VESTLRDGFFLEYFGVALADACYQAGPVEAHEASLYNIKTFFGWVSDTKNFVETFQKESESLKETKLAVSA
ncbi:MAG: pyrimidine utilization protein B, partial [Acinetobacter sp.]